MIFATCGSSHFGFDRMMEALAALPAAELEVQHGPSQPPPGVVGVPFLPFDDLMARIHAADVVVSHAGVGSILCAIRAGHTPLIFPRLKRFRETVDDHQEELAEALSRQGSAIVARSGDDLVRALLTVPPRRTVTSIGTHGLVKAVRASVTSGNRRRALAA
jgi:UDP-N-acetylglucosamine--N-acetylmuramyl-(pentapeptide) pyrophosphoryl-undecaprenol N-acetylglucosamine transferase